MSPQLPPLLVVAGPTAAGKSAVALATAARLDGEIVSADAVAVYRGLDVGSDKPSSADRARIPHHLVDTVDPRQRYSAGEFAAAAARLIAAIRARGRVPLLVGGSHFYIQAVLQGLFPAPARRAELSAELHRQWQEAPDAMRRRLARVDPVSAAAIGPNDRQRVVRALEYFELCGEPISSARARHRSAANYHALMVAPTRSFADLCVRIDERVDRMFASGLVEEVEGLLAAGVPGNAHAMTAIGYRQVVTLIRGECTVAEAIHETKRVSRRFAKRQLAWLRRWAEPAVHWVPPSPPEAAQSITMLWREHSRESRV